MGLAGETQLWHLLYALGLGFWLGLYYELFRTLRLLVKPTAKSCFFQDVFFCISAALITFFTFLAIADGETPLYLFVGEAVGFFTFYGTVGRVLHRQFSVVLRTVGRLARRFSSGVSRFLYRWLAGPLSRLYQKTAGARRRFAEKTVKLRKKVIFFSKKP